MKNQKSYFNFTVNNAQESYQLILQWLQAYQFQMVNNGYYVTNDGKHLKSKNFEFYYNGSQLCISAYIGDANGKFYSLEDQTWGWAIVSEYNQALNELFQKLQPITQQSNQQQLTQESQQANHNQAKQTDANEFENKVKEDSGRFVVVSFVLSILFLILSFFGVTFGAIVIIVILLFAIKGLKSNRRGMAIASLVITGIALAIVLITIIISLS